MLSLLHLHGPLSIMQIIPKHLPIHLLLHQRWQYQSHLAWSSIYMLKKVENNQNTSFRITYPDPTPQKRAIKVH